MPHRRELGHASTVFDSLELNGSFYSLQRPEHYARWRDETPRDFVFAVKGSRYITHMLKLRGIEPALANFLASSLANLREKLGPSCGSCLQISDSIPSESRRSCRGSKAAH